MYQIWRKITKNLAYMQEMSSINFVFSQKTPSSLVFEGEELFVWAICCMLFTNLDRHIG